jgi:hypothetical protein
MHLPFFSVGFLWSFLEYVLSIPDLGGAYTSRPSSRNSYIEIRLPESRRIWGLLYYESGSICSSRPSHSHVCIRPGIRMEERDICIVFFPHRRSYVCIHPRNRIPSVSYNTDSRDEIASRILPSCKSTSSACIHHKSYDLWIRFRGCIWDIVFCLVGVVGSADIASAHPHLGRCPSWPASQDIRGTYVVKTTGCVNLHPDARNENPRQDLSREISAVVINRFRDRFLFCIQNELENMFIRIPESQNPGICPMPAGG